MSEKVDYYHLWYSSYEELFHYQILSYFPLKLMRQKCSLSILTSYSFTPKPLIKWLICLMELSNGVYIQNMENMYF